jgi:hypothetical protein
MQIHNREEIIKRGAEISRLRENIASLQAELGKSEAAFDELLGNPTIPLRPNSGELLLAGMEAPEDRSLNQQILDIIEETSVFPANDIDAEQICAMLPSGVNITSVRSALARLADQQKIRRTTRGRYGSIRHGIAIAESAPIAS